MFTFRKPASVVPARASKANYTLNKRMLIKPVIFLISVVAIAFLSMNWSTWLALLDQGPIRSYNLAYKPQFTTDADIRQKLSEKEFVPMGLTTGGLTAGNEAPKGQEVPILKGYFAQDVQKIKQKLLEIPWVKDVLVQKVYPYYLNITLFEYMPVAVWNENAFLSDKGVVFHLPTERFERANLPILFGPENSAKTVLDAWARLKQDLNARHFQLKSMAMDSRGAWTVTLDNDIELRLGRGDWLPKIERFSTIFPHIEIPEGKQLAYVDLRYDHGAAIGFRVK